MIINRASEEAKNFYSAGTSFSLFGCAGVVQISWLVLGRLLPFLKTEIIALLLSAILVFAYAYIMPEPINYPNGGKRRITPAEGIFGFFNTFIVFAIVLGLNTLHW